MKSISGQSAWIFYVGVLCLIAGVIVSALALFAGARGKEAQMWVGVPANLLHLELRTNSPLSRRRNYRTIANYEYSFEGVTYSNSSVALFSASMEGLRHSEHKLYNIINTAKSSAQGVTAFVNPKNPSEAVLDRDVSDGAIKLLFGFSAAFGVLGIWLIRMDRRAKGTAQ